MMDVGKNNTTARKECNEKAIYSKDMVILNAVGKIYDRKWTIKKVLWS